MLANKTQSGIVLTFYMMPNFFFNIQSKVLIFFFFSYIFKQKIGAQERGTDGCVGRTLPLGKMNINFVQLMP